MYRVLLIGLLALLLNACKQGVSPEAYMAAVNNPEKGLITSLESGNFQVNVEYKTPEFLVLNEMLKNDEIPEEGKLKEALTEQQKMETFFIRFKAKDETDFLKQDLTDKNQYYERLNYYNGNIQSDLMLIAGSDTLPCTYTYLERNYGVGQTSTLIVAFEKELTQKGNLTLIWNEQALGIGLKQVTVLESNVAGLPPIKF